MKHSTDINKENVIFDTTNGLQNGVVFAATYEGASFEVASIDKVKSCHNKSQILSENLIIAALTKIIEDYSELRTTVNSDMRLKLLECIRYDDVHGKTPMETFYLHGQTLIFHGHDALFDSYAAASFHKLFLNALNSLEKYPSRVSDFIFQSGPALKPLQNSCISRQPALVCLPELCTCYDDSLSTTKALCSLVKGKTALLTDDRQCDRIANPLPSPDKNTRLVRLCGKVVFGTVESTRLSILQSSVNGSAVTLQTFLAAAAIFSLQSADFEHISSLKFSIPMTSRNLNEPTAQTGLYHKNNISFDFPLSDYRTNPLSIFDAGEATLEGATLNDQTLTNKPLEKGSRFDELLSFVSERLRNARKKPDFSSDAKQDLALTGNEDLIHRKKTRNHVVEIIDLTENTFSKSEKDHYFIQDAYAARSRKKDVFMSIHFCLTSSGLTVSIHYPEENSCLDAFVEHFESLIELYPKIV
ncbi:Pbi1p LALA0_S08e00804g [Lachancea lanzarotensis]|uniref:LALA0S08e00804g1_1 n=1 Tax=Lachancea lanzarotensis TaxID=1245769 RepID=A0A0C7NA10_9SACH|nr:uncharacterized protein LALA0_S08e00804g [Lachancea lanzarotensis]CEP63367.1 LALA0S08e00804g1_1 [Lachancea lanzarotensis]